LTIFSVISFPFFIQENEIFSSQICKNKVPNQNKCAKNHFCSNVTFVISLKKSDFFCGYKILEILTKVTEFSSKKILNEKNISAEKNQIIKKIFPNIKISHQKIFQAP